MKKYEKFLATLLAILVTFTLTFAPAATAFAAEEVQVKIVVEGYEWGPAVSAVVVVFGGQASGFDDDTFTVVTANVARNVTSVQFCDEEGNPSEQATSALRINLAVEYNSMMQSAVASPFSYDWMTTQKNVWASNYSVTVAVAGGKSVTAGGEEYADGTSWSVNANSAETRLVPQTATWNKFTHTTGNITLTAASWAPQNAKEDGGRNPLVIWLHGAGEGGTDIDIALLGNEVTALTAENKLNVQKYFVTDVSAGLQVGCAGAYVLAVQTPTIWMDVDGTGTYNTSVDADGAQQSYYTAALWETITQYVDGNDDIDKNRIYLGGCSNGGYMTMNMMFEHGDYFAAFYPVCEAYSDARISDEMIEKVKDYAVWFLLSANDPTVAPSSFELPTFARLVAAGASNVHMTLKENVVGADQPNATYNGHWSWIYTFNDDVKQQFDNDSVDGVSYLIPENCTAEGNMWKWLAEQNLNKYVYDTELPTPQQNGLSPAVIALIVVAAVAVVAAAVIIVIKTRGKKAQ